jgi:hypothetical protein
VLAHKELELNLKTLLLLNKRLLAVNGQKHLTRLLVLNKRVYEVALPLIQYASIVE